jgi:hypothetical protein
MRHYDADSKLQGVLVMSTSQVRLQSSSLVHTPGIFAWAKNGFAFKKDRPAMINTIAKTYGLLPSVAEGLLSGSLPYEVVDDTIVFSINGPYKAES